MTDDPVQENFDKNKSQIYKGGRIILSKKGIASSHHDNIRKLRQRLSDASTRLDADSNIEVNLPQDVHPQSKNARYRVDAGA